MTHISTQARLRCVTDGVLCRALGHETILIAQQGQMPCALNPVGTAIWNLADGQRTIAEIAAAVNELYDVAPDVALQDTLELVAGLVTRGLMAVDAEPEAQAGDPGLSPGHEIYLLNPAVAIEDFGERSLALHCEELRLVELNATARDIALRLDGKASLYQVAEEMANDYGQPLGAILEDVQAIVAQMVELGLVEQVGLLP